MMKRVVTLILSFLFLASLSFAESGFELDIEKGEKWTHEFKIFFKKIEAAPQIAVWVEDENGNYLETIYVNKEADKWKKSGKKSRKYTLPIWMKRSQDETDEIAGATINDKDKIYKKIEMTNKKLKVYLEINSSFDYNEYYTKNGKNGTVKAKINGQPSLVYLAEFNSAEDKTVEFKLIGHGSVDGESSEIYSDISKITDAKDIMKSAKVTLK